MSALGRKWTFVFRRLQNFIVHGLQLKLQSVGAILSMEACSEHLAPQEYRGDDPAYPWGRQSKGSYSRAFFYFTCSYKTQHSKLSCRSAYFQLH